MVQTRSSRTDQEWMELIKECRSSGLSDKDWCDMHDISRSNFYYHLRKLRKQACEIPEAASSGRINLRQEVVPVVVKEDNAPSVPEIPPSLNPVSQHLPDHAAGAAICIHFRNVEVQILNGADSDVIRNTLSAVGALC